MADPVLVDDFVTLADWSTFQDQSGEPRLSSRHVKHSGGSLYLPADGGSVRLCRPLDNTVPGELYVGLVWLYMTPEQTQAPSTIGIASRESGGTTQTVVPVSATAGLSGWNRLAFSWTQPDWAECWMRFSRGETNSALRASWWSNLRVLPAEEGEEE